MRPRVYPGQRADYSHWVAWGIAQEVGRGLQRVCHAAARTEQWSSEAEGAPDGLAGEVAREHEQKCEWTGLQDPQCIVSQVKYSVQAAVRDVSGGSHQGL